jgi:vacuolar-type H+-ATPase subunit H
MTDSVSPLQAINQKESELRRRIEEAYRQAEARIQAARQEAEQIIARADREGRVEAEALYQREIEEAQRQAKAIVAAADEDATALRCQAAERLDNAARRIVELVLPGDSFLT